MAHVEQKLLHVLSPAGERLSSVIGWSSISICHKFFYLKDAVLNHCLPHKNKKTCFLLRKVRSYSYIVTFNPLKISSVFIEYLPRAWFFYMIFWYFFLLLLWSIIWHQLFLLLATFVFGPVEKTATCVIPGIRDFGHWFWKIGCDAHNLQSFNGLISKKKKVVGISHLGTTMWLTNYGMGRIRNFVGENFFIAGQESEMEWSWPFEPFSKL